MCHRALLEHSPVLGKPIYSIIHWIKIYPLDSIIHLLHEQPQPELTILLFFTALSP